MKYVFVCILSIGCAWALSAAVNPPQRIASSTITSDEILYELLKSEGQSLQRLVAVSVLADNKQYSPIYQDARKIPHRVGNDLEALLKLKPDLVFVAAFNRPEWIRQIRMSGVRCEVLPSPRSFEDSIALIQRIGSLIGSEELAKKKADAFRSEWQRLLSSANSVKPTFLNYEPSGALAAGNTLLNDVITAAGGVNVLTQNGLKGWPTLNPEALATYAPDWILRAVIDDESEDWEGIKRTPGFAQLTAVQKARIVSVPGRLLASTSFAALEAARLIRQKIAGPS